MSNLHDIQKSLADRLDAEFENSTAISDVCDNTDSTGEPTIIGLPERAQEKEVALEKSSKPAPSKKAYQPIGIALVMFAFAAVIIVGETIL